MLVPVDLLVSLVVRKVELLRITSLLSGVLVEGLALAVDLEVMVEHHQVHASLRFMFC